MAPNTWTSKVLGVRVEYRLALAAENLWDWLERGASADAAQQRAWGRDP
ncbi:hypothetical protein [Sphaerobacter sp.]|nr:hypothetical protein [Sphaerobacter sp.]MBX5446544.1 hypothetical protein [Sphaerobacter sp.]